MLSITALAVPGISLSNVTAFQLLVAGGLLLAVAAFLLALSRERRVSMRSSAVTDELAIHMSRIANALENIANPTRDRSHFTDSSEHEVTPPEKASEEAHRVAYSMFVR
jgi:hypothetical protein